MPTTTQVRRHLAKLDAANTVRHHDGAARQIEQAKAALPKLRAAKVTGVGGRTQAVVDQYCDTLELRIAHPRDTVAQLARRAGMSKGRFWSIMFRGLKFADKIPGPGACRKVNCVCASVPGWPRMMGGHIVHIHADKPTVR